MANLKLAFTIKILESILKSASPDIKDSIKNFLVKLEDKARLTKNPFDDILVKLLMIIFD